MTSTRKGAGGVLKFVTCLWILFFLNNRSLFIFADGGGRGVKKLVIFCGRHKWMTPNSVLKLPIYWFFVLNVKYQFY